MRLPLAVAEYIVIVGCISITTWVFLGLFKKDVEYFRYGLMSVGVITSAYFSYNFAIFLSLILIIVIIFLPKNNIVSNVAFYFTLLPLLPMTLGKAIPFPGLQQLFYLTYALLLSFFILLPIFLGMIFPPGRRFNSNAIDRYVVIYFIYVFFVGFRFLTFTNSFRSGFTMFFYNFLPYIAIAHVLRKEEDFCRIFKAFIFTGFIFSIMAIVEVVKRWHFYAALYNLFDISSGGSLGYVSRLGFERASGSFAIHIIFGMWLVFIASFCLYMFLTAREHNENGRGYFYCAIMCFIGILCTGSRGPLIGGIAFIFFISLLEWKAIGKFLIPLYFVGLIVVFSPIGKATLSSLPFVGTEEQGSVSYREDLWNASVIVIKRSPLFGNDNYQEEPEIKKLYFKGGNLPGGGVDIVNTYLHITLKYGLIGSVFFSSISLAALFFTINAFLRAKERKIIMLGKILTALILTMDIMIATVSFISFLPTYYFSLMGLSAAYISLVNSGLRRGKSVLTTS